MLPFPDQGYVDYDGIGTFNHPPSKKERPFIGEQKHLTRILCIHLFFGWYCG